MNLLLDPKPLGGTVSAIPSKSDAHRLMIALYLSGNDFSLIQSNISEDIAATYQCLAALNDPFPVLNCGESGSTLRFLLPVAAALGKPFSVTGRGRLPDRPLGPLMDAMVQNGCAFDAPKLPFTVTGQLKSGTYTLPGNVSSQWISGLLLALPLLSGDSRIELTSATESGAYIQMTLQTLRLFGIRIKEIENGYEVPGGQKYIRPTDCSVEGDWSNAAVFLAAGAMASPVTVRGLSVYSLQADRAIIRILSEYGADIAQDGQVWRISPRERKPLDVDVSECPDLFPVLAILACGAKGRSVFRNAARLRLKESDRIFSVASLIASLGGTVSETHDSVTVDGTGMLYGGEADSFGDHRIVMAAALASVLATDGIRVTHTEAIQKSYPQFWNDFETLGGSYHVI